MLAVKDNKLYFEDWEFAKLSEEIKPPFAVISERELHNRFVSMTQELVACHEPTRIDYFVGSNNEVQILRSLSPLPINFEVGIVSEYFAMSKAIIPAKRVTFRMAGMTSRDLDFAVREEAHAFYVDSMEDLQWLNEVANQAHVVVNFIVNVNCNLGTKAGIEANGMSVGISYNNTVSFIQQSIELANTRYLGVSMASSGEAFSKTAYLNAIELLVKAVSDLENEGLQTTEICLHGEFPIGHDASTGLEIVFDDSAERVVGVKPVVEIGKYFHQSVRKLAKVPVLVLRTSEFFISDCGAIVATVQSVEDGSAVLDISVGSLPDPKYKQGYKVALAGDHWSGRVHKLQTIVGKIRGDDPDVFVQRRNMPELQTGDQLIFLSMAAISVSHGQPGFDTDLPIYLIKQNGEIKLVERRND